MYQPRLGQISTTVGVRLCTLQRNAGFPADATLIARGEFSKCARNGNRRGERILASAATALTATAANVSNNAARTDSVAGTAPTHNSGSDEGSPSCASPPPGHHAHLSETLHRDLSLLTDG